MDDRPPRFRPRSLFWPLVLITVGAVWLLVNVGQIGRENLTVLLRLWPLILIFVGLDILVGRRWPALGALIGLGFVVLVIALLVYGPRAGLATNTQVTTTDCAAPLGGATAARVELHAASGGIDVYALTDSANLLQAHIVHVGTVRCDPGSGNEPTVRVEQVDDPTLWLMSWSFDQPFSWAVGLAPNVPLTLDVEADSGNLTLDLSRLRLRGLELQADSGNLALRLPASGAHYAATLQHDSGNIDVTIAPEADVLLSVENDSGNLVFDVPDNMAWQLTVDRGGSGEIEAPAGATEITSGGDRVWKSRDFDTAATRIVIDVQRDSGNIIVR